MSGRKATPTSGEPHGYSAKRLALNSASNTVRFGLFIAITFFITPFIVRTLGNSLYGLWVVLMSFVAYADLLELGLQRAMVKLVAENRAAGDMRRLNSQMSAAFFFFLASGILVTAVFAVPLPLLIEKLARGVDVTAIPYALFPIMGVDVAITFLNYVFTGILYGWQLYHRKNIVDVVAWILNAVLVVLLLGKWNLVGLAVAKTLSDLACLIATVYLCRRTIPELAFRPGAVTRAAVRDLFTFGGKIFISSTMSRIATNAQPIVISSTLSASATAFFSIPKRLTDTVRQVHWAMVAGFMPMFSDLNRRGETDRIRQVYVNYSRRILLVMLPLVVLVLLLGAAFIGLWIGPEYGEAGGMVLLFLSLAYLAELFQPLLWSLFIGTGQLNLLVANASAMSALLIGLTFLFVGPLGIAGVALASAAVMALGQILFTWALCQRLSLSFGALVRHVHLRPGMLASLFFGVLWGGKHLLGTGSYWAILGSTLLSGSVYVVLVFRFGLVDDERTWFLNRFRKLRERSRRHLGGTAVLAVGLPPQAPDDEIDGGENVPGSAE